MKRTMLGAIALAIMSACGTLHRPAQFELATPMQLKAIEPVLVNRAGQLSPTEMSSFVVTGCDVLDLHYGSFDASAQHRCQFAIVEPKKDVAARGVCVLLPGIIGLHSSPSTTRALCDDGWHVLIVAPPLVKCVLETMRTCGSAPLREQGVAVAKEFDRVVDAMSYGTTMHLLTMVKQSPQLSGKPVLLVGESMGALVGVGLAASGVVPFDAALFVAGGGSLLDVVGSSSIRRLAFGDLPINDPEFRAGFAAAVTSEPLMAAETLRSAPIVLLTARDDIIVPAQTQDALWMALGQPPRYIYDGGHISLFVGAPITVVPVIREIAEKVGTKGVAANALFAMALAPKIESAADPASPLP